MPLRGIRNGFDDTDPCQGPRPMNLEEAGVPFTFADIETQYKHKNPQKRETEGHHPGPVGGMLCAGLKGLRDCRA